MTTKKAPTRGGQGRDIETGGNLCTRRPANKKNSKIIHRNSTCSKETFLNSPICAYRLPLLGPFWSSLDVPPNRGGHSPNGVCPVQIEYQKPERLLRLPAVLDRVGYKRSRFLDLVRQGVFPKPIKLGARAVAWPESQIDELVDRLAAGRGA